MTNADKLTITLLLNASDGWDKQAAMAVPGAMDAILSLGDRAKGLFDSAAKGIDSAGTSFFQGAIKDPHKELPLSRPSTSRFNPSGGHYTKAPLYVDAYRDIPFLGRDPSILGRKLPRVLAETNPRKWPIRYERTRASRWEERDRLNKSEPLARMLVGRGAATGAGLGAIRGAMSFRPTMTNMSQLGRGMQWYNDKAQRLGHPTPNELRSLRDSVSDVATDGTAALGRSLNSAVHSDRNR